MLQVAVLLMVSATVMAVLAHGCAEKMEAVLLAESGFADGCRCVTGKLRWLEFAGVSDLR